jgi:hypothetical protein
MAGLSLCTLMACFKQQDFVREDELHWTPGSHAVTLLQVPLTSFDSPEFEPSVMKGSERVYRCLGWFPEIVDGNAVSVCGVGVEGEGGGGATPSSNAALSLAPLTSQPHLTLLPCPHPNNRRCGPLVASYLPSASSPSSSATRGGLGSQQPSSQTLSCASPLARDPHPWGRPVSFIHLPSHSGSMSPTTHYAIVRCTHPIATPSLTSTCRLAVSLSSPLSPTSPQASPSSLQPALASSSVA